MEIKRYKTCATSGVDFHDKNVENITADNTAPTYARKVYYAPTLIRLTENSSQVEGGRIDNQNENTSGLISSVTSS